MATALRAFPYVVGRKTLAFSKKPAALLPVSKEGTIAISKLIEIF
jgi:hypothetical protein